VSQSESDCKIYSIDELLLVAVEAAQLSLADQTGKDLLFESKGQVIIHTLICTYPFKHSNFRSIMLVSAAGKS